MLFTSSGVEFEEELNGILSLWPRFSIDSFSDQTFFSDPKFFSNIFFRDKIYLCQKKFGHNWDESYQS